MDTSRKESGVDRTDSTDRADGEDVAGPEFPSEIVLSRNPVAAIGPESGQGLHDLEVLVGAWKIEGRTVGSQSLAISGRTDTRWSRDGRTLEQRTLLVVGREEIPAIEIIRFDPGTQTFPAVIYTNGSTEAQQCLWRIRGDRLVHSAPAATFRGRFSANRRVIRGRWTPRDPTSSSPESAYTATLRRID